MMRMSFLNNDKGGRWLLGILLLVSVIVPIANLIVPESSPLHISTYTVALLGKYLC